MKIENKKRVENDYIAYFSKKYPNLPVWGIPKKTFSDSNTKRLTDCILSFLTYNGHHASEQHTTGTMIDKREIVTDILGRQRQIGTVQWGQSKDEVGRADIIAKIMMPFKGRLIPVAVEIEIKFGYDKQSEVQKNFQTKLENLGGIYVIIKTFDQFIDWYDNFININ